jgi:hypothetical protein
LISHFLAVSLKGCTYAWVAMVNIETGGDLVDAISMVVAEKRRTHV